ncbi:NAD(P)-dependent oxidoreductase [Cryptosporangium sp. NPDC048952]|uniref:NAD(P)-dependent oxidoreductase n=1 Tax=Cryptosporangium sp. NPDC048952 TaxID=3363961 RepID=UPI00370FB7EB
MTVRIAILGATGATGALMVTAALARGLSVTALARRPDRVPPRAGLTTVAADVLDPETVARAAAGHDVLLSGLGSSNGAGPGTLTAGARAAVASGVEHIVWLGALGTGPSAAFAGVLTRTMIGLIMKNELPDKVEADSMVLTAGATLFHLGPMNSGPASPAWATLPLAQAPRRLFPRGVSRATVAEAMVDEAVRRRLPGQTVTIMARYRQTVNPSSDEE